MAKAAVTAAAAAIDGWSIDGRAKEVARAAAVAG